MIGKSRLVFTQASKENLLHIPEEEEITWNPNKYFRYTLFVKLEFSQGNIELLKLTSSCDLMLIYLEEAKLFYF